MKVNWIYSTQFFLTSFWTILGLFTVTSCSNFSVQSIDSASYGFSKINCYVRYMAQNRELQGEMTFRTDSTQAIEGAVMLNGMPMSYRKRPIVGLQYRLLKNSTNFDSKYTFSYAEKNGLQMDLSIELSDFNNIRVASDGIYQSKGGVFEWEGAALTKTDGLIFIFTDAKGNTFSINHTGISKGNKFEIIADHAKRLALGEASVQVVRKKTIIGKDLNTTRMLTIEYYCAPIKFEVKE